MLTQADKVSNERLSRIQNALYDLELDAIVCSLPSNVLLLSGYWPVLGASIAICTKDQRQLLIIPEDEAALAKKSWIKEKQIFSPGSLREIRDIRECVSKILPNAFDLVGLQAEARVAFEIGEFFEPTSYVAMHLYQDSLVEMSLASHPDFHVVSGYDCLQLLRSRLTPFEINQVRNACRIAQNAFLEGVKKIKPAMRETEVAVLFRSFLSHHESVNENHMRADGFIYCMSGPNSAQAYVSFQRSTNRQIKKAEFILIHCNSYLDGYWTDITRTYFMEKPPAREQKMYEAILTAKSAALEKIRPGVKTSEIDRAAREILEREGFGSEFKHPTGHGVGFAAIHHHMPPCIHPVSQNVLEEGMVFNIEPGIYIDGLGGLRHCDLIAVTKTGFEILTPFQSKIEDLVLI